MKTCTCPHEATRNGFMRTGYNSLCPFHGVPLQVSVPAVIRGGKITALVVDDAVRVAPPTFCECGHVAGHDGLCERFDET